MKIIDLQHLAPPPKRANGRPRKGAQLEPMTTEELQVFWSAIVRGQILEGGELPALKDRLRASELLAKSHLMFEPQREEGDAISDAELEERVKRLWDNLQ